MQSSANVKLSPEEHMTVSVAANDLCDGIEGGICVSRMSWLPIRDGNEGIPLIAVKKLGPSLF